MKEIPILEDEMKSCKFNKGLIEIEKLGQIKSEDSQELIRLLSFKACVSLS